MNCSNCGKEGAERLVRKGEEELYLCKECYERLLAAAACGADADELFFEPRCPECGCTYGDYMKSGLLGCPECYRVFGGELMPEILRIQGKTVHTGKQPLGNGKLFELTEERERLRKELERAIRERRMSDAERINRDIRAISRIILRGDFGEADDPQ